MLHSACRLVRQKPGGFYIMTSEIARLMAAALNPIVLGGKPSHYQRYHKQPPGVAAPLTGAFSLPVSIEGGGALFVDICMGYV